MNDDEVMQEENTETAPTEDTEDLCLRAVDKLDAFDHSNARCGLAPEMTLRDWIREKAGDDDIAQAKLVHILFPGEGDGE